MSGVAAMEKTRCLRRRRTKQKLSSFMSSEGARRTRKLWATLRPLRGLEMPFIMRSSSVADCGLWAAMVAAVK